MIVVPNMYKFLSAVMLIVASSFVAYATVLQGAYPTYSVGIGFAVLILREFVKDYGTVEVPAPA